ncbi:hypothetical protein KY290_035030 [Solanum tuberosum]|uniref:Uncharacterized protein n=1 Tax=Solanum tuberosum TaxID=4113 RepID=A0ABQ7U4W8_SOLTU|nr:hypothetical protein KY289_034505 [Solanum tuberosum]KAH0646358.1 hypothetical protein KY284_034242 [Solanum tuberosum]KAH0649056.1 hypothetical protein KY285_034304 [Solanum tuberosum]KAH0741987.1 hypothetical protein KY290_035030 [Solanum tuberosum]
MRNYKMLLEPRGTSKFYSRIRRWHPESQSNDSRLKESESSLDGIVEEALGFTWYLMFSLS